MPASTYTVDQDTDDDNFQPPGYTGVLFDWVQSPDKLGAPLLTPKSNSSIDVFENFPWTLTPPGPGRKHIPRAILTEYRQTQSSELRGYLYSIRGQVSNLSIANKVGGIESAQGFTNAAGQSIKTAATVTGQGQIGSAIQEATNATVDKATQVATSALDEAKKFDFTPTDSDFMDPYKGLYAVENTGFVYTLPYFTQDNMAKVQNTWAAPTGAFGQAVGKVAGGLGEIFKSVTARSKPPAAPAGGGGGGSLTTTLANKAEGVISGGFDVASGLVDAAFAATAGAKQTEELKAYGGSSGEEEAEFSFYLYNTIDDGDPKTSNSLRKNWELCFILTYQNLPNRKGINFLDAPCLYRVDIPGFKLLSLATLEGISIKNVGNTRLINLNTGEIITNYSDSSPDVKLMPEAYSVSLKFKSVLKNTRNTFLSNADPAQKITITTSASTVT